MHVLVLEDEMMVAMLLEAMLEDLGCQIAGPVSTVAEALALIAEQPVEAALLDVNLSHGQSGYPVAAALAERGVPFAFVTGYGAGLLNPEYRDRPTLQKPFHAADLKSLLQGMVPNPSRPAS